MKAKENLMGKSLSYINVRLSKKDWLVNILLYAMDELSDIVNSR